MSSSQTEILFFETIAHDGEIDQVLQVDEIKFEQAVYIDEIRVLPAGYSVSGLEKSTTRTGGTKPMPCELEFFGKNLNVRSNRDRVRYRRLGKKVFRDDTDIAFYPSRSIPTDSLIVKGKYDTLTVAVVGVLAHPKSPPARHDPPNNNRQIVDFLQSAPPPHRAHPMDTLSLAMAPPVSGVPTGTFAVPTHSHPPAPIDTAPSSSSAHTDGVWVAPPEQNVRQPAPMAGNFPHSQAPRAPPNFVGQGQSRPTHDHMHDYSHQPVPQQAYLPNRPSYSSSDYAHGGKSLEEMDDKHDRVPIPIQQYRPNLSDHLPDDMSSGVPMITPPFSHPIYQHQYSNEHHRRGQDPSLMQSSNQQETASNGDSYLSDDNTSESEASSIHGILFNEDEQQAFKRDALYNTRGSTRFTTLKTFHSPTKTSYEVECEKAHHEKYRHANEELIVQFRKLLSHVSIDHCNLGFLESLESICTVLPVALACLDSNEEQTLAIQRLTEWSLQLINIEYAISKQFTELDQTLLKIRIMKCGVRLCGHLSVLTEEISDQWMTSDYQSKLLDLYDDPCLAPSVKLLIIRILDQSLFFKSGLLWFTGQHPEFPLTTRPSPYFRLLEKLQLGTELKQITAVLSCLLRKIHLYEELLSFEIQIKSLSSDESPSWTSEQAESRRRIFDDLVQSLSTVRDVLINATDLISQEKTSRLASCQSILSVVYAKLPNNENPWPCVLRWLVDTDFLKSLTVLIHLCILNHRQDLFNLIEDILREFFNSFDALVFLANQIATPNGLLKALYYAETKFEDMTNDPVGPQLICAFQTLTQIDELKFLAFNDDLELDHSDLLQVLHCLLSSILFHHYIRKLSNKRQIIVRVLAMESNFHHLLKLIEISGDMEALKTSIRTRYVARIIYEIFATSDSVLLLEPYGTRLLSLCEKHSNQRLVRLRQWLSPLVKLKQFDHSQETADNLISELKSLLQESNQSGELSPGLLTVLRLIQHLSIAPESQFTLGAKIELKYDYMLLKLFHQGIYSLLITVLEKCAETLLCSWQIGIPLNIPDRLSTFGVLIPALILFRTLLQKLMIDRKTKFIDTAPVRALLSVYTVTLCASPSTELIDVDLIRTNIIDTFLAYTWSMPSETEPMNVQTCPWTLVLQEILRVTTLAPYSMTSGLCLLTELLPIPLPHTVRQALTNNEVNVIKDDFHRYHTVLSYIWTHDANHHLQKFLQTLSHTSNSIMQEVLRRLCTQLIDLGPKLAKPVMKTLMDELISTWKNTHNEASKGSKLSISDSGRLVAFIATLIAVRSGKCALLALLNSSDEKYATMIKDLLEYLHIRAESNETCLCQDATMSMVQTLCDANLCLSSSKSSDNPLQFLANALPKQELISQTLTHILRLLSSTKQQQTTWTQTTMALRTMISLAEHDFGLQMIRTALLENQEVFCTLIADFDLRFDKEQPDYLEAVSALMVFLQRIMTMEALNDSAFTRTKYLPSSFFADLLGVSANSKSQLEKFIELINDVVNDEPSGTGDNEAKQQTNGNGDGLEPHDEEQQCLQTIQKILERANSIIQSLKSNQPNGVINWNVSISLPKPESMDVQFQHRLIYTVIHEYTDDQRASELYWLGIPTPALLDDVDYGQDETTANGEEINDKVRCDLEDLIGKYCGTFNFFDEYKKEVIDRIRKKRKSPSKKRPVPVEPIVHVDTSIITTSAFKSRTPWSAPMRGNNRRNLRPGGSNMHTHNPPPGGLQRRTDHFRNRPLNTSRPPSMHVDEFEKQFNDNGNGSGGANSSSANNNNANESNSGGNNGNDNDMMGSMQPSNDNGSDRERWSRRGATANFRSTVLSNHRYPALPSHLPYPVGAFGLRERLPYGYPQSRYSTYEMEFQPPYFGNDELPDDRLFDYHPMSMPMAHLRYRGHFGRFNPGGYH